MAPPRESSHEAESPSPPQSPIASTSKLSSPILIPNEIATVIPPELSGGRAKKFPCLEVGCGKAFTRPSRLEEHNRSHTGEKPFKCPQCTSSFGRDSHLKAHMRTHATEDDKKYPCGECEQKFWTNQHLKKHREVYHLGKTYDCTECGESFRKHNLLKAHLLKSHSEAGTDPFACEHPGCDRTFKQNTHLKAHIKTHDLSRYNCAHRDCLYLPIIERSFSTWSALQKHHKIDHPPRCSFPDCEGKTFTTTRGLKHHLVIHEEQEDGVKGKRRMRGRGNKKPKLKIGGMSSEEEINTESGISASEWENSKEDKFGNLVAKVDSRKIQRKRKAAAETEQETEAETERNDYRPRKKGKVIEGPPLLDCSFVGCKKTFKTIEAQAEHFNRLHPDATSATPIIVNPFAIFRPLSMPPPSLPPLHVKKVSAETQALMNSITGLGYGPSSNPLAPPPSRHIPCQYPGILQIAKFVSCDTDDEENHTMDEDNEVGERKTCAFRFKRIYDLERHLKSAHGVYVELESLTRWVEKAEERE